MLAHNGEINTLRGNVNLMKAREGVMSSSRFGKRVLTELYPVVEPNLSDSGSADCVLEFLVRAGGRSLPEVRPLIPSLINSKSVRNPHRNDVIFLKKYFYSGRIPLILCLDSCTIILGFLHKDSCRIPEKMRPRFLNGFLWGFL